MRFGSAVLNDCQQAYNRACNRPTRAYFLGFPEVGADEGLRGHRPHRQHTAERLLGDAHGAGELVLHLLREAPH